MEISLLIKNRAQRSLLAGEHLLEALAGRAPFRASGVAQVVHRILYTEPDALPDVDERTMAALRRALTKEAAARTPDVATFALEFTGRSLGLTGSCSMPVVAPSGASDQETRQARPVRPAATAAAPRSRRALFAASVGLLVVVITGALVALRRGAPREAPAVDGQVATDRALLATDTSAGIFFSQ